MSNWLRDNLQNILDAISYYRCEYLTGIDPLQFGPRLIKGHSFESSISFTKIMSSGASWNDYVNEIYTNLIKACATPIHPNYMPDRALTLKPSQMPDYIRECTIFKEISKNSNRWTDDSDYTDFEKWNGKTEYRVHALVSVPRPDTLRSAVDSITVTGEGISSYSVEVTSITTTSVNVSVTARLSGTLLAEETPIYQFLSGNYGDNGQLVEEMYRKSASNFIESEISCNVKIKFRTFTT